MLAGTADTGLWATLMFQITGDRRYVDLAWRTIDTSFLRRGTNQLGGNFAREYSAELVLLYDWLYPGLSSAQRATFLSKLNDVFRVALTNASNSNAPVRMGDSDQTVGVYFGLAFLFVATADHNPEASDFFYRPFVGGLTATTRDRTHASKCDPRLRHHGRGRRMDRGVGIQPWHCAFVAPRGRGHSNGNGHGSFSGNHPVGIERGFASVVCRHARPETILPMGRH